MSSIILALDGTLIWMLFNPSIPCERFARFWLGQRVDQLFFKRNQLIREEVLFMMGKKPKRFEVLR